MSESVAPSHGAELRPLLGRYRLALRALSLLLVAVGLAPLSGLMPLEPAHTLGLLGCQLFGLSLTFGNALAQGGLSGFLRAQAIGLLLFAGMRSVYVLAGASPAHAEMLIEILLPAGIAGSFLFLRSRL